MNDDFLCRLQDLLDQRRDQASADSSYVASLHAAGINRILEKVGEECTELLLAAKDADADGETGAMIRETADLWFHSLVMLSHLGCHANDVLRELEARMGTSGHEEKARRNSIKTKGEN